MNDIDAIIAMLSCSAGYVRCWACGGDWDGCEECGGCGEVVGDASGVREWEERLEEDWL